MYYFKFIIKKNTHIKIWEYVRNLDCVYGMPNVINVPINWAKYRTLEFITLSFNLENIKITQEEL